MRQQAMDVVSSAQYKTATTWIDTPLIGKTILLDGRIEYTMTVSGIVTAVRLLTEDGTVLVTRDEDIVADAQTGLLYKLTLRIEEATD